MEISFSEVELSATVASVTIGSFARVAFSTKVTSSFAAQFSETLAVAETTTLYPEVPSEAKRVSESLKASFFSLKTFYL